jgi:ornithine cyclodeaminase/alanine dehydrogenase-like protein (mu-crystallin family)
MLMINNEVAAQMLTMRECIEVQEAAFADLLQGKAIFRPRIDTYVPCDRADGYYRFGSVEGASDGVLAVRLKSDIVHWPKGADGSTSENKFCMRPGMFCGLVFLYSMGTEEQQKRLPRATRNLKLDEWPVYTDVLSGKAPGRAARDQITHYRTIGNWGVQFSSVGALVYRKAKAAGLGRELPTEWFLQDIRN